MMRIDKRLLEPEPSHGSKQLTEREEWEKNGCSNNEEWHRFLNKQMWREYTSDLKNGCYIGTHESNLNAWKQRRKRDIDID